MSDSMIDEPVLDGTQPLPAGKLFDDPLSGLVTGETFGQYTDQELDLVRPSTVDDLDSVPTRMSVPELPAPPPEQPMPISEPVPMNAPPPSGRPVNAPAPVNAPPPSGAPVNAPAPMATAPRAPYQRPAPYQQQAPYQPQGPRQPMPQMGRPMPQMGRPMPAHAPYAPPYRQQQAGPGRPAPTQRPQNRQRAKKGWSAYIGLVVVVIIIIVRLIDALSH